MSIYQKVMESKQLASEVHEFLASGGQIKTYQGCEFSPTIDLIRLIEIPVSSASCFLRVPISSSCKTHLKILNFSIREAFFAKKRVVCSGLCVNSPSHMTREEYRLLIAAIKRIENGAKS